MNTSFKFSVLISIYYKEKPDFFDSSMKSIWDNQTLKPNEIILVKDGMLTDELNHVINTWINKIGINFKVVSLPTNVGLGKALNEGLKFCSYDYVARMDSDDIAASNRFELQIKHLMEHPELAIFGGQVAEFEDNHISNITGNRRVPLSHNDIIDYNKKRCPFNHPTVLFNKKIINDLGGYQHHLYMEDYNLWMRVISRGYSVGNLGETLVYMRAGQSMISRRRGFIYVKSEWKMAKLKIALKNQSKFKVYCFFIIRSVPRLMPSFMLVFIYKFFLRQ